VYFRKETEFCSAESSEQVGPFILYSIRHSENFRQQGLSRHCTGRILASKLQFAPQDHSNLTGIRPQPKQPSQRTNRDRHKSLQTSAEQNVTLLELQPKQALVQRNERSNVGTTSCKVPNPKHTTLNPQFSPATHQHHGKLREVLQINSSLLLKMLHKSVENRKQHDEKRNQKHLVDPMKRTFGGFAHPHISLRAIP